MTTSPSVTLSADDPSAVSTASIIWLFAFVVVAWSLNWVVMKVAVQDVTPLWAVAIRTGLAALVLFPSLSAAGQLRLPPRGDLPIVLVIALFHMVAFASLMTAGLVFVPASRAIVLGYTTPLWVAPAAFLFLGERVSARQAAGIAIGIVGLLMLFKPSSFAWGDETVLLGNGLIILAALCWSVSIVYTRAHRWVATPLQLMPWQCLLATVALVILALALEGPPPSRIGTPALLALAYNGFIGTALGFWAMTVVNRRVPATTASLGVLATPVLGIGLSAIVLAEGLDPLLIVSALTILFGIALGARGRG
ncbi:DMT family transporter [Methylobacterium sp. Leaf117]|uniref:DMT family transporter n=1 Tax=Methylobacterium sp. Leaf117 TaxID=1736260 RepID=UPI000ADB963E|nr:DMT family transporter [Methylobacterium sp. Leaf117]